MEHVERQVAVLVQEAADLRQAVRPHLDPGSSASRSAPTIHGRKGRSSRAWISWAFIGRSVGTATSRRPFRPAWPGVGPPGPNRGRRGAKQRQTPAEPPRRTRPSPPAPAGLRTGPKRATRRFFRPASPPPPTRSTPPRSSLPADFGISVARDPKCAKSRNPRFLLRQRGAGLGRLAKDDRRGEKQRQLDLEDQKH